MYKTSIDKRMINEILEFRKECFGLENKNVITEKELRDTIFQKKYNTYSSVIFENEKIKSYILIDKNRYWSDGVRIKDMICPDLQSMYLQLIEAIHEFSDSHKIIVNKYFYDKYFLKIFKEDDIKLLYIKEDLVAFKLIDNFKSIDFQIMYNIHEYLYAPSVYNLIEELTDNFKLSEIIEYKDFILNELNEYYRDKNSLIGDKLKMVVAKTNIYANKSKAIKNFKKNGYIKVSYKKIPSNHIFDIKMNFVVNKGNKNKELLSYKYIIFPLFKPIYDGKTPSYYRGVLNRQIKNYMKIGNKFKSIKICDKYGREMYDITSIINENKYKNFIPYNNDKTFENSLNKSMYKYQLELYFEDLQKIYKIDTDAKIMAINLLLKCRLYFGINFADEMQERLNKYIIENKGNSLNIKIHDFIYPKNNLLNQHHSLLSSSKYLRSYIKNFKHPYFTDGALCKILLNYSINKNRKINDYIEEIETDIKYIKNVKELRANLSKSIRKDNYEDFKIIIGQVLSEQEKIWKKNFQINKKTMLILKDYVEKLNRYKTKISMKYFCTRFKRQFLDIINKTYPGLFKEELINIDYLNLGLFIQETLKNQKNNRKIRKLYTALNKIQNINDIKNGKIDDMKYDEIIKELKQRNIEIPKEIEIAKDFVGKVEQKCSPEFLIAGDASVCCMSFSTEKAKTYALEEGFGIFNVYYKERIIANSLIWINDSYNCLIIDNIEVAPNYQFEEYEVNISNLYFKTIEKLLNDYKLSYAVQGSTYNDLKLFNDKTECINLNKLEPRKINTTCFYSDAEDVYPISINMSEKEIIKDIKSVNSNK